MVHSTMIRAPRGRLLTAVVMIGAAVPARAGAQGAAVSLALQPDDAPRTLVLSDQARRYLLLQYRGFPTEFMGCMIGSVTGRAVVVDRIAPADVDPAQSTATWVVPRQTCESAGWTGTVGTIHSHPSADKCWYFFPGTGVPSSDGASFLSTTYPVDAIMCGERIVWINRALAQQELTLTRPRSRE